MMTKRQLYIANKNYSSWSFRAWIGLKHFGIDFTEHMIPLNTENTQENIRSISPSGTVPILQDGDLIVGDSLAILEYGNEISSAKNLLPQSPELRAIARSACAEMHSGFIHLRQECPMNMKLKTPVKISPEAIKDIHRIYEIWDTLKSKNQKKGSFLLGDFGMVDAYFAPVVSRIISYGLDQGDHAEYITLISNLDLYKEWENAALKEESQLSI